MVLVLALCCHLSKYCADAVALMYGYVHVGWNGVVDELCILCLCLQVARFPLLMGQVAASVKEVKPAKEIIDDMVEVAIKTLQTRTTQISRI